ncbi:MAG: LytTR family DNA-binding domain-containing protein [Candidatus Izemoplasmatales bacterium]
MKIRIVSKPENYNEYKEMLEKAGFSVSDDADIVFQETVPQKDSILGEKNGQLEIIPFDRIIMIESFGRLIILHTLNEQFSIREKLFELEIQLDNSKFTRINKSMIIAKSGIKKIIPSINGTMSLLLKNNMRVTVSRIYRASFKKFIGY